MAIKKEKPVETQGAQQAETKTFTKLQILQSKQHPQRDILSALLQDGQGYTHDQVKKLLEEFLKKEAK